MITNLRVQNLFSLLSTHNFSKPQYFVAIRGLNCFIFYFCYTSFLFFTALSMQRIQGIVTVEQSQSYKPFFKKLLSRWIIHSLIFILIFIFILTSNTAFLFLSVLLIAFLLSISPHIYNQLIT